MKMINGERRYNAWAGNPNGRAEDPALCVEEVTERDRGAMHHQCYRKRGFGPDGLYCKRHSENFLDQPVATYYRTSQYSWDITATQVYKETEKTITLKEGSRLSVANKTGYYHYWPTREEALNHLRARLDRMRAELESAERAFAQAENQ